MMRIISRVKNLRVILDQARRENKKIGFVPTMGAFHEGHRSLMRRCRRENDIVVVSIFVNPTQFGPHEDFSTYPRQKKNDCLLAKKENIDIIFYPTEKDIYPEGYLTYIDVEKITHALCGQSRLGHFRGVTTIVGKLLNIVSPKTMYLGQKDAQQCVVLQRMVRDLNFPVKVKILPTVRERDGLAMSSRNKYLTAPQRREASIIYQTLRSARKKIKAGETKVEPIRNFIRREIRAKSSGTIDYVDCVDMRSLNPIKNFKKRSLIALAVKFGTTRLIDNIIV